MNKLIVFFFIASTLVTTACTHISTTVVGNVAEAVDVNEVKVFYNRLPDCEFEVIAHIEIPGEYFSREKLLDAFKKAAAEIGANGIHITHLQKEMTSEYYGTGRAIRCQ